MGVCDLELKGINFEFFNLFYNKNEEIEFLISKTNESLEVIKDKLISPDVTPDDIDEVGNCIDFFNKLKTNSKNRVDLLIEIKKTINKDNLENFKKFIDIFKYLDELSNNSDNLYNLYYKASIYSRDAKYFINLNYEEYKYKNNGENIEKSIDLQEIKRIKHKINIPNEVAIQLINNKDNELSKKKEKKAMKKK